MPQMDRFDKLASDLSLHRLGMRGIHYDNPCVTFEDKWTVTSHSQFESLIEKVVEGYASILKEELECTQSTIDVIRELKKRHLVTSYVMDFKIGIAVPGQRRTVKLNVGDELPRDYLTSFFETMVMITKA